MGNRPGLPEGTIREWNGYSTIKQNGGWRYTHHVIAEEQILHRPLNHNELVCFRDNDRTNLNPSNLEIKIKRPNRIMKKRLRLRQQIREAKLKLENLEAELRTIDAITDQSRKVPTQSAEVTE